MSIFKENLTSQLLRQVATKKINKYKKKIQVLELGCGDGNISRYIYENQNKNNKHEFFASDISKKAIQVAQKKNKIIFKSGYLFEPWKKMKFDVIISDVSSINDTVAKLSPWYKNVICSSGDDGLRNIKNIVNEIFDYSKKNSIFILPVISLCNVNKLTNLLEKKFKKVSLTKKIEWPLPFFFKKNIKIFLNLKRKKNISFIKKFGIYIAYTRVAICKI